MTTAPRTLIFDQRSMVWHVLFGLRAGSYLLAHDLANASFVD
jgi:hypothetical protein